MELEEKSLFVGNLPYEMTDDDIHEALAQHTHVTSVRLMKDSKQQSIGCAIVKILEAKTERVEAISDKLRGLRVQGRELRADPARQQEHVNGHKQGVARMEKQNRLFVGNLSFKTSETELIDFIKASGFDVLNVSIIRDKDTERSRGFGFVDLQLSAGATVESVCEKLNGAVLNGRPVVANAAIPQRPHSGRVRA